MIIRLLSVLFFSFLVLPSVGQEVVEPQPAPVVDDSIQFKIPVGEGGLRQNARRLPRFSNGRLQRRVDGALRGRSVDLNRPRAELMIRGLDYILGPDVNVGISPDKSGISVDINPAVIGEVVDSVRGQVMPAGDYGLTIYPATKSVDKRLVILIHGFNSSPARMEHIVQRLRSEDFRVATFYYQTEAGVEAAAKTLAMHLRGWTERNPDYKITLLTHSMGGVCARCMVENDDLCCEAVDQLIMIAPPNHGSELARIGMVEQPLQNAAVRIDRPQIAKLISTVAARINSAIGDMRPDSEVLKKLNAGERNDSVQYSILLGNKAPLSQKQAVVLAEVISSLGDESPVVELAGQQAADTLNQLSEEIVGRGGDGVVSVYSGRLVGVDDTEVLSFKHNDLLEPDSDGWKLLEPEILERMTADRN